MGLPRNLITNRTAKLPGDHKKQGAVEQSAVSRKKATRRKEAEVVIAARRNMYRVGTEPVTVRLPFPPMLNSYYRTAVVCNHAQTYISAAGKNYRQG